VLAAILKAILARLFVGNRPFPKTLLPLMRLSGHSRSPRNEVALVLLFAHIPSRFAEDGRRGCDIDAVNPGEVRNGDLKQLGARGERWLIPSFPHQSCFLAGCPPDIARFVPYSP
jgi:hypothetical protein